MGGWRATWSAALVLAAVVPAAGESGLPDSSFGTNGVVTTELTPRHDNANAVAIQPDGKILVAGAAGSGFGGFPVWGIVRYLPDGRLDDGFGDGGIVLLQAGQFGDHATGVAVLPDGKIIVSGSAFVTNYDFAAARLLPDGTLDPTFGTNGITRIPVNPLHNDIPTGLAIQPDGGIVLGGYVHIVSNVDFAAVRLLPDGQPDPAFGTGGMVIVPVGPSVDMAGGLALQPDGKIVLAGTSAAQGIEQFAFVRLLPDGTLDPTFGVGGKTTLLPSYTAVAESVLVEPDGRITAAGYAGPGPGQPGDFALARLLPDGTPDPSFGTGGTVRASLSPGYDLGFALVRQPDGALLVAGQAEGDADSDAAVARFTADGALDPTFGAGGFLILPIGFSDDRLSAAALQPDGRLVAVGRAWTTPTNFHFVTLRLTADPVCGDGIVALGEDCDDGNTVAGDCCSPLCRYEPAGTPCHDDGNPCTEHGCDDVGSCSLVAYPPYPCDDGLYCNGPDVCAGGVCVHAGDPCAGGPPCADVCDEATASCLAPAGAPCPDDGDPCTADVCDGTVPACIHPPVPGGCC